MLIRDMLPLSCYRKKLQNLSHLSYVFKFARSESSSLQCVGLLQEKVRKTHITDLDELKQRLRMEWAKLGHVDVAAIRQWRCR